MRIVPYVFIIFSFLISDSAYSETEPIHLEGNFIQGGLVYGVVSPGVKIIVSGETVILYFDQNLDLNEQKQNILKKTKDLEQKINIINEKLKNKSFLKNAPKLIVDNEKKALVDYKIELKKLNSILNSIKN